MNTSATYLPSTTAKANSLLVVFISTINAQCSKMHVWAFSAAVRLSDQNRSIGLKLLVELAIVIRILALLAQNAHRTSGKAVVARRATHASARVSARRVKSAKRTSAANVRQSVDVAIQRRVPMNTLHAVGARSQSSRPGQARLMSREGRVIHDHSAALAGQPTSIQGS